MFLRFVIAELHWDSGRRTGVFQAAYRLRRSDELFGYHRAQLSEGLLWFNTHLEKPRRLAVSRRPHAKGLAICWFRHTAVDHIGRAREVAEIVAAYDRPVEVLQTSRPGYVVYEDRFQVAAYPFADTPC